VLGVEGIKFYHQVFFFGLEMLFLDLVTIRWAFEITRIVGVGFRTGMEGKLGKVHVGGWCAGYEEDEDTGMHESLCAKVHVNL
jgi:hypothetical protein